MKMHKVNDTAQNIHGMSKQVYLLWWDKSQIWISRFNSKTLYCKYVTEACTVEGRLHLQQLL